VNGARGVRLRLRGGVLDPWVHAYSDDPANAACGAPLEDHDQPTLDPPTCLKCRGALEQHSQPRLP
jgi:hypothetical protein